MVGVARDALRLGRLQQIGGSNTLDGIPYVLYRPWSVQSARPVGAVTARVLGSAASVFQPMRAALHAIDPGLRVRKLTALGSRFDINGDAGTPFVVFLQLSFCALAPSSR